MEPFEKAEMEIIKFSEPDVITASLQKGPDVCVWRFG